jgi:hypothetical protein
MKHACHRFETPLNRRQMLRSSATGFGYLALADLLSQTAGTGPSSVHAAEAALGPDASETARSTHPLAPRATHFPARAKRVIFLFMHGGPSQIDTFDHKPLLSRDHGKPLPFPKPRVFSSQTGNLLRSPWKFSQHGESGTWVSELFPHVARQVDDLCVINSMYGSNSRHGGALLELHTGSDTFVRPSMGSWITYGLGSENQDLPGFITVCPTLTHGGVNNFSSAFLPAPYQGTPLGHANVSSEKARIPYIQGSTPRDLQRMQLDLLQSMNREHIEATGPDDDLEGRISAFELAFRMQTVGQHLQDLSDETPETRALYGLDEPRTSDFARQCIMARRFAERGVRFVQVSHSYKWDQHGDLRKGHSRNSLEVDQPIAGLLQDLKRRGLLDDTLVLWGGEFGRTPVAQGDNGRDHNPQGFTMWLAGGGVRGGMTYGSTDDYGYFAVENRVHFHDLHATLLHLLGLDHTRLTYRHAGREFRLTDVHGRVVKEIFA